jgi:5S rRNA maturation endonuclease (ribonuclease M5)
MFDTIKKNVDILAVAEKMFDRKFIPAGDKTFEPDDKECPFCGHKDCFKVKQDGESSLFKCFSCDVGGDVIGMVAEYKKLSVVEASRLLAKEFKLKLPSDFSPVQEVFNLAAEYYLTCMKEAGPSAELAGLTPLEFQIQKRGHTLDTINTYKIGWSDGKVIEYLEAFGIEKSIILESGLMNKKGYDFLPSKCFIYPHMVRGRVSHFTFKDPLKQKEFQVPNRHKLNGHSFYNSDSIKLDGPVIIVEGENDALSLVEAGWKSGVICCNGSISTTQLEWVSTNLAKRDVITMFDTDPAGDKYREKVQRLVKSFNSLLQVKLTTGVKDIDEYLKAGGDLKAAMETGALPASDDTSIEIDGGDANGIIEKNGAYYKVRMKEGNEFHIKLSNFVIQMRNIYIRNGERERDIIVVREDGLRSDPINVNSDCKVSVKPFKTLMSNAVDASFYGKEEDLTGMWEYVYAHSNERVVHLPDTIGRIPEFGGWLFRDVFITDAGAIYKPDESGVIWISNNSVGLKPVSLIANIKSKEASAGIPFIGTDMSDTERDELLEGFIKNLGENIGSLGDALTIVGWAWASIYSDNMNKIAGFFPLLYFWGRFGKGKSSIIRWVECLFNMEEYGYTTFAQLNSGVSFGRKLSYYAGLPMCVDELRAGRDEAEMYGTFRSWYDRVGKATGTREGFGINEIPIRATLMFGGEDQFTDPATRSRCIPIRISAHNRETVNTFTWIDNRKLSLSAIGYHWILNYGRISHATIVKEFKDLEVTFKGQGVPDRGARNWAAVSIFANRLCERYFPDFNYMQYVLATAKVDVEKQKDDDTLIQFWEVIEGMQSEVNPKISRDHFKRVGDTLHVWFTEIFRIFMRELPFVTRESFSKAAVLEGMKDESYFLEMGRTSMGVHGTTRRVLTIDLTKAPEVLHNIASYLD